MKLIRPGMGTENASLILTALIRMIRPRFVFEIGAGDSTIAIAHALQEATADWIKDRTALRSAQWSERVALLDPATIPDHYEPTLVTVDDFTGEGSSAAAAWSVLEESGVDPDSVQFINQDFFDIAPAQWDEWGPFDMGWVDAGTPADDVRFAADLWDKIRPGGYLVFHEPTMLTPVQKGDVNGVEVVRTPLWEELTARAGSPDFELITLPEAHKYRQSGIGLIRKRLPEERIIRSTSMQRELLALGVAPIRNDLLPIGIERTVPDAATTILTALREPDARKVYSAIMLGATSMSDIARTTNVPPKSVGKSMTKLLSAGLITSVNGRISAADTAWTTLSSQHPRDIENLTDQSLETPEVLAQIASMFTVGQRYSEAALSAVCSTITVDFARLRRRLVDDGYLTRTDNIYLRPSPTPPANA